MKFKYLFMLFICGLLLCGCENSRVKEQQKAAWKACVDSGGVPIQSWFNEGVLADCKFPPAK